MPDYDAQVCEHGLEIVDKLYSCLACRERELRVEVRDGALEEAANVIDVRAGLAEWAFGAFHEGAIVARKLAQCIRALKRQP